MSSCLPYAASNPRIAFFLFLVVFFINGFFLTLISVPWIMPGGSHSFQFQLEIHYCPNVEQGKCVNTQINMGFYPTMTFFDLKFFSPIGHTSATSERKEMAYEYRQNRVCSTDGLCPLCQ